MEIKNNEKFIKGIESLIKPMEVSNLLYLQKLKALLPPRLMKKMLHIASKSTPYIGFVIEPYSLFLFFKLKNFEAAKAMLPDRYELSKTKLFDEDEPEYYMGLGNLGTRASTFWGTRQEAYLIATDKETGLLSFIFIDILSNTLISLPKRGVDNANCKKALFTTSPTGEIFLDIEEDKTSRHFALRGKITTGKMRSLYQQLWLMGNTSIAYSKRYADKANNPFAVIFDPAEVKEALDIPPEDIEILENTLFPGLAEPEPSKVICFPFAQHYKADSPGCYTTVKDRNELISKYNKFTEKEDLKTFSSKTIVKQILAGIAISTLIAVILILFL